jgi:glycosyltransferase involved in cell wall biosynthesis
LRAFTDRRLFGGFLNLVKVSLVTETYPPEVNGVAMTLSRLTTGIATRGHDVEVVRPRQKEEVEGVLVEPGSDGITRVVAQWLVPGAPIPFYKSLRMGLPVQGPLMKRWRETRPDVVHVATEGPLGFAALQAAKKLGLPVTSSFHTNFHQYGGHYGLRFGRDLALRYLRWFHNQTRCTLAPTDQMCAQLCADGFERLRTLARGVDADLFTPAKRSEELRARWGVAPHDPVVIYVGRIAAEKNLTEAVEAFLAMQAVQPRAKFVLVGDGPERAALEARHPEFHYAGMRRGEELAAHYASADGFLFASVTETFGNVITEAMASGLVVIAYDYAATRQHVRSGQNGFAAVFGNKEALVATAITAVKQRNAWPAIRAAARVTALTITWDAIIDRFEDELRGAANGRAAPAVMVAG